MNITDIMYITNYSFNIEQMWEERETVGENMLRLSSYFVQPDSNGAMLYARFNKLTTQVDRVTVYTGSSDNQQSYVFYKEELDSLHTYNQIATLFDKSKVMESIDITVSEDDKAQLHDAAAKLNLSFNQFMTLAVLDSIKKVEA